MESFVDALLADVAEVAAIYSLLLSKSYVDQNFRAQRPINESPPNYQDGAHVFYCTRRRTMWML